jgi:hypothetical protein
MISSAVVSQVRKEARDTRRHGSRIIPDAGFGNRTRPLGIRDTRPMADAPSRTARAASSSEATQQTLTLGRTGNITEWLVDTMYGNCIQFYRRAARVQRLRT